MRRVTIFMKPHESNNFYAFFGLLPEQSFSELHIRLENYRLSISSTKRMNPIMNMNHYPIRFFSTVISHSFKYENASICINGAKIQHLGINIDDKIYICKDSFKKTNSKFMQKIVYDFHMDLFNAAADFIAFCSVSSLASLHNIEISLDDDTIFYPNPVLRSKSKANEGTDKFSIKIKISRRHSLVAARAQRFMQHL